MTLIELMLSMSLMAVVTLLASSGLIMTYRVADRSEALADVQQALHMVYSRLDTQVRYADGISSPGLGTVASNKYVEFTASYTGATVCTQIRAVGSSGLLQSRTQPQGGSVGPWTTMASHLSAVAFARTPAAMTGPGYQQLTISLTAQAGNGATAQTQLSSVSFTALNTTVETASDTACSTMGRP